MWGGTGFFSGFRLKYSYEEKTILQPKEILQYGTLTGDKFHLWSYLEWLPKKFDFQYYSHHLETDNLRCEKPNGCSRGKNSCWCNVAEKLVFKDSYQKTFKLKSSNGCKYLLDVQIDRRPSTTDQVDLTLSIRYDDSSTTAYNGPARWGHKFNNSTTTATTTTTTYGITKLSYFDQESNQEVEFTNNNYLAKAEFEFKCRKLPDKIVVKAYSTSYLTREGLRCQKNNRLSRSKVCPEGDGVTCWCSLINQLRSTRSGRIRIPIFIVTNGNYSKWSNYFLIINAIVDPEDHDQIEVKISFINNPLYEMNNISYINF